MFGSSPDQTESIDQSHGLFLGHHDSLWAPQPLATKSSKNWILSQPELPVFERPHQDPMFAHTLMN